MDVDEGSNSIWRIVSSISTQNYLLHFIFTDFISLSNFQLCLLLSCLFWSGERDIENWGLFWKYANMIRWRFENWVEPCIKRARKHCFDFYFYEMKPNIKIPGKSWKKSVKSRQMRILSFSAWRKSVYHEENLLILWKRQNVFE